MGLGLAARGGRRRTDGPGGPIPLRRPPGEGMGRHLDRRTIAWTVPSIYAMAQFSATTYSPRLVVSLECDPLIAHALGTFTATFLDPDERAGALQGDSRGLGVSRRSAA
jgi:hypothetical protein